MDIYFPVIVENFLIFSLRNKVPKRLNTLGNTLHVILCISIIRWQDTKFTYVVCNPILHQLHFHLRIRLRQVPALL